MAVHPQTTYMVAALVCASIGAAYDLRSRRIPNLLTGPALVFGLLLHVSLGGFSQLGLSMLGGLIAGSIFFLFFMAGGMGAGDVKLMIAVGCLAGTVYLKEILILTVLAGAAMGITLALFRGRLRQTVLNVVTLVQHHVSEGLTEHPEFNLNQPSALRVPYAIPIAVGCLLTFLLASGKEWIQ